MTAARRKRVSERIYPRIAPALAQRLAKHAAASGISETSIVEAALEQYLDRTSDTTLLLRRLDRLGRAQERSQRDQELHAEAFAAFVRMWFAQTPSIPQDARRTALASAEARFRQFLQYVAQQISKGGGFFDQLPREPLGDDQELSAISSTQASHDEAPPNERGG
jgi:hypothetical protein